MTLAQAAVLSAFVTLSSFAKNGEEPTEDEFAEKMFFQCESYGLFEQGAVTSLVSKFFKTQRGYFAPIV